MVNGVQSCELDLTVPLRGGETGTVELGELSCEVLCDIDSPNVASFRAGALMGNSVLYRARTLPAKLKAETDGIFTQVNETNLIYLATGGTGDGHNPLNPLGDLNQAIRALEGSGTVVLCGPYQIGAAYSIIAHDGQLTLTSLDCAEDYRSAGAYLEVGANLVLGGETLIEEVKEPLINEHFMSRQSVSAIEKCTFTLFL